MHWALYLEYHDLLDVVSKLRDAEQGTVNARMLDALMEILLVELSNASEDRQLRPVQGAKLLDLHPQRLSRLVEEGLRQDAGVALAEELGEEAMGIKRLIPKEEKCHLVGHDENSTLLSLRVGDDIRI